MYFYNIPKIDFHKDFVSHPTRETLPETRSIINQLIAGTKKINIRKIKLPPMTSEMKKLLNENGNGNAMNLKIEKKPVKRPNRFYKQTLVIALIYRQLTKELNDDPKYDEMYVKALQRGKGKLLMETLEAMDSICDGMAKLLSQGYNTKESKKPCSITYFRKRLYMPKIDEDLLSFDKNGAINNTLHKSYSKSLYTFSDSMRLFWHLLLLFFIYRAILTDRELSEMLRNIFYKIMCYIIELLYSEKTYEEFSLVYHQLLNDIECLDRQ